MKRIFGGVITLLLLLLLFAGCGTGETKVENTAAEMAKAEGHTADTVKIGFVDVTGTGLLTDTLGIARDKGYIKTELDKIGVSVKFVPMTGAGPAINEALASGSLDFGFFGDVPAVIGKASNIDTKLISYGGLNSGASLVLPLNSEVKTVKELKGKKIATQKGAFMHKVLVDILKDGGLTINDIQFINLNAQSSAEVLVSGNVDGVVVGGSTLTQLVENGYRVLSDYRDHPEWQCDGYGLVRTVYANENPDIVYAILQGLIRAKEEAIKNKNLLAEQWVSTGLSASSYNYLFPKKDNYFDIQRTPENFKALQNTIKFLKDNNLIVQDVDAEKWSDDSYYKKAFETYKKGA